MYRGGIIRKTPEQLEQMAAAGRIQSRCLQMLEAKVRPGVTTKQLEAQLMMRNYEGFLK